MGPTLVLLVIFHIAIWLLSTQNCCIIHYWSIIVYTSIHIHPHTIHAIYVPLVYGPAESYHYIIGRVSSKDAVHLQLRLVW